MTTDTESVESEMPWPWSIDESDPTRAAQIRDANGDIVAELMYRKDAELCLRAITALAAHKREMAEALKEPTMEEVRAVENESNFVVGVFRALLAARRKKHGL